MSRNQAYTLRAPGLVGNSGMPCVIVAPDEATPVPIRFEMQDTFRAQIRSRDVEELTIRYWEPPVLLLDFELVGHSCTLWV